jgi:hypothetical protein
MKKETPSWLKRTDESAKAYEAFEVYRNLGYERTLTLCANTLCKRYEQIWRWSKLYDWEERTTDYDNEISRAEMKKAATENKRRYQRFGKVSDQTMALALTAMQNITPDMQTNREVMEWVRLSVMLANACNGIVGKENMDEEHFDDETDEGKVIMMPYGANNRLEEE